MKDCDSDDVNIEEINREFTNQKKGEQLIAMGFKVKFFNHSWNLMLADGVKLCKLDIKGSKRDALEEALKYVKVKKI